MDNREYSSRNGIIPLARALSKSNVVSRSQAALDIKHGLVLVDGKVVNDPAEPVDINKSVIHHKGEKVVFEKVDKLYIAFNKPPNVVTSTVVEPNAPGSDSIMSYFKEYTDKPYGRIFPVGRLDRDSTGLIFLTNDPLFLDAVTSPANRVSKEYVVLVAGQLTRKDIEPLLSGIVLPDGKKVAAESIKIEAVMSAEKLEHHESKDSPHHAAHVGEEKCETDIEKIIEERELGPAARLRTKLRIILVEGKNREIRRMFSAVGFKLKSLKRVRIGPVRLLNLQAGTHRILTQEEVMFFLAKAIRTSNKMRDERDRRGGGHKFHGKGFSRSGSTSRPDRAGGHGPSHGPSHGPRRGSGQGPARDSSRGPSHGPSHGPNRGTGQGPARNAGSSSHGPSHGPRRGSGQGPARDSSTGSSRGPRRSSGHAPSRAPGKGPTGPGRGPHGPGKGSHAPRRKPQGGPRSKGPGR
jgi:pseudouridine synthase